MPYRKPKRSYVLPVVTSLAVAAPLAALIPSDVTDYRSTTGSELAAVPAQLAEVVLTSAPDLTLPLRDLTGLDLPDLHLSDLRKIPLPETLPVPQGLPVPPGVELPAEIPLPDLDQTFPDPTPTTPPTQPSPAGAPAAVPGSVIAPVPGNVSAPVPSSDSAPVPGSDFAPVPGSDSAPVPGGVPPAGAARFVAEPTQLVPGTTADTPALAPGAVPRELLDQIGAQVKQVSRDTPFSVVALTARDLADTTAMVRAKQPDGTWGEWFRSEQVDTRGTDTTAADRTAGTEPIYVGSTDTVQILVTRKEAATVPGAAPITDPLDAAAAESTGTTDLTAVLIDPGTAAIDGALHDVAVALPGGGPQVISRAQWGADESIRCDEPTYDDGLGGITVHHTAGRNDYSKSESAGIVRAIYTYHARTLGWCDIGYNALVDKYGQVFEGRAGGLDRPVQGAHAGGFNENTAGVAFMGNHESEAPSTAAVDAAGAFIGWRARAAGLDPRGSTTMYSEGTEFTPYAQGESVDLPIVFAHRDVGHTTCPGDAVYGLMDRIRDIAAGSPARPGPARTQSDLAALAELTGKLLTLVDENIIARYWADKGGPDGPLGSVIAEPKPTASGGQYAEFTNGHVYATSDGRVFEVLGQLLDRFLQLGGESGILGMPAGNAYPVPDGLRSDFEYGSLILNQVTGIVTTVWKTYNDTYRQEMGREPGDAAAAPVP